MLLQLLITDIQQETNDAATFTVKPASGETLHYIAGQFITLVFLHGDKEIRRSYSFSSTPGVDQEMFFTVKRVHNGEISRLLLDKYVVGDMLNAAAPAGKFIYDGIAKEVFLIAAGGGITPVFSLLKEIIHNHPDRKVFLIYQNNSRKATIFRKQLEALKAAWPERFEWLDFISSEIDSNFFRKLTNDRLEELVPNLSLLGYRDAMYYICGPVSFMRMCQFTLLLMGVAHRCIKKEYFVIEPVPAAPLVEDETPKRVTVFQQGKELSFETHYPDTILRSGLKVAIPLPYSCQGGRCSACVARCIRGKVIMSMNDVLTEKEVKEGLILTCVGYAVSDVELRFD